MSRGFAEEETHDVCKVCDYAIRNEECPGCGFSFESFSIKEHDAAIRRQTIEEFVNRVIGNSTLKSTGEMVIEIRMDIFNFIQAQMKGEAE